MTNVEKLTSYFANFRSTSTTTVDLQNDGLTSPIVPCPRIMFSCGKKTATHVGSLSWGYWIFLFVGNYTDGHPPSGIRVKTMISRSAAKIGC